MDAVRMKERVGHLEPQRLVLPRRSELIVVLQIVFVAAVHRDLIRAAGAADGGLETAIARNGVIGQDAAVPPAAYREPIRVRDSSRHQVIDAGQEVLDFLVAPIGEYGLLEIDGSAAAASIVDAQDDIALGREHLRLELIAIQNQGVLVLAIGAAVDP